MTDKFVTVPVEQIQKALEVVRNTMQDAYNNAYQTCCGRAHGECCGNPDAAWSKEDEHIMDVLAPVERELSALLAAAPQEPEKAEQPQAQEAVEDARYYKERYEDMYDLVQRMKEQRAPEQARAAISQDKQEPVAWNADFENAFQLVFECYAMPRDKFNTDEEWSIWQHRQVTRAFSLLQKLRALRQQAAQAQEDKRIAVIGVGPSTTIDVQKVIEADAQQSKEVRNDVLHRT